MAENRLELTPHELWAMLHPDKARHAASFGTPAQLTQNAYAMIDIARALGCPLKDDRDARKWARTQMENHPGLIVEEKRQRCRLDLGKARTYFPHADLRHMT